MEHLVELSEIFTFNIEIIIIKLAPGDYCPEKATVNTAPKYSFGLKTIQEKMDITPGKCNKTSLLLNIKQ